MRYVRLVTESEARFTEYDESNKYAYTRIIQITTSQVLLRFWKLHSHTSLKKRPALKKFILRHNNVQSHTSTKMIAFLTKQGIKVMEYIPFGPYLALANFWLSLCLQSVVRGLRFDTNEAFVAVANSHFNSIDASMFAKTWVKQRERWDKCIVWHGYFFQKEYTAE